MFPNGRFGVFRQTQRILIPNARRTRIESGAVIASGAECRQLKLPNRRGVRGQIVVPSFLIQFRGDGNGNHRYLIGTVEQPRNAGDRTGRARHRSTMFHSRKRIGCFRTGRIRSEPFLRIDRPVCSHRHRRKTTNGKCRRSSRRIANDNVSIVLFLLKKQMERSTRLNSPFAMFEHVDDVLCFCWLKNTRGENFFFSSHKSMLMSRTDWVKRRQMRFQYLFKFKQEIESTFLCRQRRRR